MASICSPPESVRRAVAAYAEAREHGEDVVEGALRTPRAWKERSHLGFRARSGWEDLPAFGDLANAKVAGDVRLLAGNVLFQTLFSGARLLDAAMVRMSSPCGAVGADDGDDPPFGTSRTRRRGPRVAVVESRF